jgi:hypothetical protein
VRILRERRLHGTEHRHDAHETRVMRQPSVDVPPRSVALHAVMRSPFLAFNQRLIR